MNNLPVLVTLQPVAYLCNKKHLMSVINNTYEKMANYLFIVWNIISMHGTKKYY